MKQRRLNMLLSVVAVIALVLLMGVKSNPFAYCGYCQHEKIEKWKAGNAYPCSFWRYVTTRNSADFTLYLNTPGG